MTDIPPPPVPTEPARRSFWERASIVWLIPLAALAIALGVAWQNYADRGPVIYITFGDASGVIAGETKLRYRNVIVGEVEKVGFSDNLDRVRVDVRLDKDVAAFVDQDASFWVVQPEVSTRGVSGLDTVLSGVYIEGVWDAIPGDYAYEFEGETEAPLVGVGQSGLRIVLRATEETSLTSSGPILFKGIEVGQVGEARLSEDGSAAVANAVIYAPYDALITSATRFWDTSGFTFSIGANGAELDFSSLASLISGGVTFETVISGGVPVETGQDFVVFADESAARASVFSEGEGEPVQLTAVFADNISGLTLGAPVELGGVRVGTVTNLTGLVDQDAFGDDRIRLRTTLEIRPTRLGLGDATQDDVLELIDTQIAAGLRARLATASILTGGLKVELVELPDLLTASLDREAQPFPAIPSTTSNVSDSALSAESILARVNDLPVEELMGAAIGFLNNASQLAADDDLRRVPGEVAGLLSDVRGVVGSDEVQALPAQISGIASELQTATQALTVLMTELQEQDGIARLLIAVDAAAEAAGALTTTAGTLPPLVAQAEALAAKANALPLEAILAEATSLITAAETLVAGEEAQAVPVRLNAALAEIEATVTAFNQAGAADRLLAAIDAAGAAAASATGALEGLPGLIAELDTLGKTANTLPLGILVAELNALLSSAETFIADEGTQAMPAALTATLIELRTTLDSANEADGAARLLAALDAVGLAARDASGALSGLPEVLAEVRALSQSARALPLDAFLAQTTQTLAATEGLLSADGTTELPAALTQALAELDGLLAELNASNGAERLLAAIDNAGVAAAGVGAATADVPALVDGLTALSAKAEALPLTELAAELTTLLASADAILSTEGAQALPGTLSQALEEVDAVLSELQSGGTVANVNATLSAAERAASSIATASSDLPQVIARLETVLAQATATLATYDGRSDINRDARGALREITKAAAAIDSLARALERRPNSILTGR